MPLFLWKKSYEIGLTEIDTQHRNLVGIINELSDAMMNQKGYTVVPHILEKLVDYIQFHFTTEEEIMRDTKYPALDEHCQEHLAMTTKVIEFKRAYAKNHEINVVEVLNFLCDWLKEHIVVSDKKLKAHIQTMDA
ncbi:bacteriohemerythrin [Deltaproteobacteria bacterium IMCC39524]|nr:bacteriohemerythrin [Deltaproteobacteria bacterium IMCC39524]